MKKTISNEAALNLRSICEKHLDDKGMLGYACARNARRLTDATLEYEQRRNEAIKEHGEAVTNEEGEIVTYNIQPGGKGYAEFMEEIGEIAALESEVELTAVRPSDVIGKLSGAEILEIDWMIEEAAGVDNS